MEISNEELFNSALSDEQPTVTEQVTEGEGVNRDEQGRFAPKSEEPETKPVATQEAKPAEQPAPVETVGMRQLREAHERAERRALEAERRALEAERRALQPKPAEPEVKPDLFEKPDEFVRANVQEALNPIQQQFSTFVETVSRRDAIREHGQETVTEAFKILDHAAATGDPQALAVVQAVKKSMDPFGDIVSWYRGNEASRNPDGFFQRRLDESLKDEKFRGELMAKLQPVSEEKPKPAFNIPPSLGRAASAAASLADGGDLSNESLFAAAMR